MEERTYNKLTGPEDLGDDRFSTTNEDEQHVSLSMGRPGSLVNHQKVLTVVLSVFAVILLTVDLSLGIYYRNLTDRERIIKDINAEVSKLQQAYKTAIETKIKLQKELTEEAIQQKQSKWELDHQKTRIADYKTESESLLTYITRLKSQIPLLEEGCRHCLPGWHFINSMCYYIPFSENMPRRSWSESQEYCKTLGADLIKIKSQEKQKAISNLITSYHTSLSWSASGFWIGARDVDVEGEWKWLDGTPLTVGFWNKGEPNNQRDEDCAAIYPAVYPRENPYESWNDAPCSHFLRWICEKSLN